MNPQKLVKWKRWLGDANTDGCIIQELSMLSLIREVFAGVKQIVDGNPGIQVHSTFYQVFTSNYAHSVLMYIRRQVERDPKSGGLIELAWDLRDNHKSVTQADYVKLYTKNAGDNVDLEIREKWGQRDFTKYFGGTSGVGHLDTGVIDSDINQLEAILETTKSFVDRRLAHLDTREPNHVPSLDELDTACDTLNSILKKYMLLLEGTDYQVETVLQHDWKAIFRVPWLLDGGAGPI